MTRFFCSILLVTCMTPFQFGCGDSAPLTPETESNPVEELDPATEAEAQKKALKNQ